MSDEKTLDVLSENEEQPEGIIEVAEAQNGEQTAVTPDKSIELDLGDEENSGGAEINFEILPTEENSATSENAEEPQGEAVASVGGAAAYKRPFIYGVFDWLEVFCYALAAMVIVFLFVFKYVTVDGDSMFPTLYHEDRLVITNFFYDPEPGDIIIVYSPAEYHTKPLVKRVIAVGGQEVTINFNTWEIYVDGEKQEQEYLKEGLNYFPGMSMAQGDATTDLWTFTVEEDHVFVMGDNRQNSEDSRFESVGQLKETAIIGKVVFRIGPTDRIGSID